MQTQPNFEKVKVLFYDLFTNNLASDLLILRSRISDNSIKSFYAKKAEFKKDLHNWLNNVDIRMCQALIDMLISHNNGSITIPNWMKQKRYIIDYNEYSHLDLIITHN